MRILRFTCTNLLRYLAFAMLMLGASLPSVAKDSKYRIEVPQPAARILNGFGVGVDGVGFGMKLAGGRFANMEVLGRINLVEKYFPVVELGIGECTREGSEQNTVFHTRAPYYRIGADYCLTKKRNGNRLYAGLRYGFSSFGYDYRNPDFIDPIWGNEATAPGTSISDIPAKAHWLEFNFGVETKLWKFIRLGWTMRYKARLYQSECPHGDPWYVPGFGKNGGSTFGGTVNLVFEIQSLRLGKEIPINANKKK